MRDTTTEADEVQMRIHRNMSGQERLQIAMDMSLAAREFCLTRLRRQNPDWSESRLGKELLRYAFLPGPLPLPLR